MPMRERLLTEMPRDALLAGLAQQNDDLALELGAAHSALQRADAAHFQYEPAIARFSHALMAMVETDQQRDIALAAALSELREAVSCAQVCLFQNIAVAEAGPGYTMLIAVDATGQAQDATQFVWGHANPAQQQALQSGQPWGGVVPPGYGSSRFVPSAYPIDAMHALQSWPISLGGQWWGHLALIDCHALRQWSAQDLLLLRNGAELLAAFLERLEAMRELRDRARLVEELAETMRLANAELHRRIGELSALNQITHAVTLWTNLPDALKAVGATMADLFDAATIGIWLLSHSGGALNRMAAIAQNAMNLELLTIALADDPTARQVITRARPRVLTRPPQLPLVIESLGPAGSGSCMLLPLRARGKVTGLVCLHAGPPERNYTPSDVALAQTIVGALANAIENARLFSQAQTAAAENERRRLARELHDSVSQALFNAALTADVLPQLWEENPAHGRRALRDLQQITRSAQAEMRALLIELRPAALTAAPLSELLQHLAAAIGAKGATTIDAVLDPTPRLPSDVQIALYRIIQEALHNVVKHARAAHTAVILRVEPPAGDRRNEWHGLVRLQVVDDGRGFDPLATPTDRLGLGNMRDRAAAIGAHLDVQSTPGAGTVVEVSWRGAAEAIRREQ